MVAYDKVTKMVTELLTSNSIYKFPVPVYSIAKNLGLEIEFVTFKPDHNNISGFIDFSSKPVTIFVNSSDSVRRQAFTIAHEIGHFQLHKKLYSENPQKYTALYRQALNKNSFSKEEKEANCFAAQLLVPKTLYMEAINKYPFASEADLAALFGVSQEMIRYRKMDFVKGRN